MTIDWIKTYEWTCVGRHFARMHQLRVHARRRQLKVEHWRRRVRVWVRTRCVRGKVERRDERRTRSCAVERVIGAVRVAVQRPVFAHARDVGARRRRGRATQWRTARRVGQMMERRRWCAEVWRRWFGQWTRTQVVVVAAVGVWAVVAPNVVRYIEWFNLLSRW